MNQSVQMRCPKHELGGHVIQTLERLRCIRDVASRDQTLSVQSKRF
jgi:hypothetical protein